MSDHPRMLYRKGGDDEYHGLRCKTHIAEDGDEERRLAKEGWRRTPAEAYGQEQPTDDAQSADLAAANDEREGLLQEIEDLRRQLSEKPSDKAVADLYKEMDDLRAERDAAVKERDETRELLAAFDRDNDGKPGGSKPREKLGVKAEGGKAARNG